MNLTDAINTFAVRLYDWSQRDFLRELESDCPLMSLMGLNNRRIAGYVSWNKTLSSDQRKALVIAMTHRAHENALRLKGETFTELDKRWLELGHNQSTIHMHELPPLATANRSLPGFQLVDADHCLDTLVSCLSPILGKPSRRHSAVKCTRKLGDWKIVTEFTFLRRDQEMFFEYQFVRKDGAPFRSLGPGPFPRTLLMFYGVYGTQVDVPSAADSEPMAKVMAKLAEYFVAQADPLFAGLGIND